MEVSTLVWLAITIIAAVVEAAVPSLVSIWFVPGGIAAFIASLLHAELWLQIVLFLVVSCIALVATRPLVKKFHNRELVSTNADMAVGEVGVVTEKIENLTGEGRVNILGKSWSARSVDPEVVIQAGEKVVVEKIEGVKLIVRPFENTERQVK